MKLLVQNPAVSRVGFPNEQILERFRAFLGCEEANPLRHQAEAFQHVLGGDAVRLEAGTASGKTLSVALPLFEKLKRGELRKIIFLYPTLALMEDQRRVMDRLGSVYGFGGSFIGTIRGGMSRSSLVDALGRSAIVATPDAVYWFLRKNVKYSHLLIYGLLLADEIVVDEAHLFAGLSAQNLAAFLNRLRGLRRRYLGVAPKVHVLTATWPKDGTLDGLSPSSVSLTGRSLVGDVDLEILRGDTPQERSEAMHQAALDLLDADRRKVLLVANSARSAHLTFNRVTSAGADARRLEEVPDKFKLSFGVLDVLEAIKAADRAGLLEAAEAKLHREVSLRAWKLKKPTAIEIRGEVVARSYGDFLERIARECKSKFWRAVRGKDTLSPAELEIEIGPECLAWLKRLGVEDYTDYRSFKEALEYQVSRIQERVEQALVTAETEKGVCVTLPEMPELKAVSSSVPLFEEFLREFRRSLILDAESISAATKLPIAAYQGAKIPAAWFMDWFDGEDQAKLKPEVLKKVEHRAVRRISDREDGAIAILYSGSMPRYAREGLIQLFGNLRVPAVLISTSAVEVGVDFDADALVTEECSGSAFLQRFGRVGRRPGTEAQVKLFVGAESYTALKNEFDGHDVVSRTDFSEAITWILPERLSLRESRYIEAVQTAVTYQIGEAGREVADHNPRVEDLLEELQRSGVEFSYGLRGTMPGVQLREGISKSPFYALRFADSERIFPPDSPFELARLDRAFDEIIYTSWEDQRDVFVDLERTWPFVRSMAYLDSAGDLKVAPIPGAWLDLSGLRKTLSQVEILRAKMGIVSSTVSDVLGQRLAGLPAGALAHPEALLFYGDIVLSMRASDPDRAEPVPYRVQDQWMLLLPGQDSVESLLSERGVANLEELYYDYDGLKHGNGTSKALGLVILEEQGGACLAAWEKIVGG